MLSFIAGFVDVIGFIALFGLFTAHVTGNFIMIGVELTGSSEGLTTKLLALPALWGGCYDASAGLAQRQHPAVAMLLAVECMFLLLFVAPACGRRLGRASVPALPSTLAGMLAVIAMGIQNALSRTTLADLGPTTIMTGNTTQIVIDLVDLRRPAPSGQARSTRACAKCCRLWRALRPELCSALWRSLPLAFGVSCCRYSC